MSKTLSHAGVTYDVEKLIKIKGQGIVFKVDVSDCTVESGTVVSSETKLPIVVKKDTKYVILIDNCFDKSQGMISVILLSKHILKKAKVEQTPTVNYPKFTETLKVDKSPWVLVSESARLDPELARN